MRPTAVGWSVVLPLALTVGMFAALLGTALMLGQHPGIGGASAAELVVFFGLIGLWGVAEATMGAVIVSRRPGHRIGRLLQAGGPLIIGVFLGFLVSSLRTLTVGSGDLLGALAGWWAALTIFPAILIAWPLVAILFPDGRLPGPGWRWPVILVTVGEVAVSGVHAITVGPVGEGLPDNPFGLIRLPTEASATLLLIGTFLVFASLGIAVVAIGARWRQGDRPARAQLKWLLGATAMFGILFPVSFGGGELNVLSFVGVASASLLPVSIAVAVLRYRLYEIDRIISPTLTYGVLTIALVGVYLAGFTVIQAILAPFMSGGGPIAVAASTLATFALSQPLRRRLQSTMDRRFNRSRYDAKATAEAFAAHLGGEFDPERLGAELRKVVGRSLAPTSVGLWLRPTARTAAR
jgi:hypothetical protein